jgi:NDP-sugar pyrophosphorylase family protein
VVLHPTARVIPPVYIDEGSRIGSATRLGPNATIGKHCILDSGCVVENAVVFPKTYVGDGLELKDVLVDKNRLINVRHNTAVSINEDFILSGVSASHLGFRLRTVVSQVSAGILVLLVWPFLFLTPVPAQNFSPWTGTFLEKGGSAPR